MRILFSAVPVAGHVLPMMAMISAAAAGEHETAILTSGGLSGLLAPFTVLAAGPPISDQIAETVRRTGSRWTGPGPGAAEMFAGTRIDLSIDEARVRAGKFGPELIVCDTLDFVGPTLAAELGVPWAVHGISGGLPPQFVQALEERWAAQLTQRGLRRTPRLAYVDPYPDLLHGKGGPAAKDRLPVQVVPFDRSDAVYEPRYSTAPPPVSWSPWAPRSPTVSWSWSLSGRWRRPASMSWSPGGTGTVISALAAGLPLVIRPVAADHPFNAARAEQLGAARIIADPGDAGAAAQAVLRDPAFRQAARGVQEQNATLPSPARVLRTLEALRASL
jgi:hypothetical protein